MPQLQHTSARALEFDSLRALLRAYTQSPLGQNKVANLAPTTDAPWIQTQQQLTEEIREYRRTGGRFDFSTLTDITDRLNKSRITGAVLEIEEIRNVLAVVDRAAEWREIFLHPPAGMKSDWQAVRALSKDLIDFSALLSYFRNKIQPDGTLEDRASPELARIRREIEKQRRSIQQSLQGYLRRLSEESATQDELITIRGERFVIPVKAEQKRRVQGVVHGASSSGQTVYIEPLETIEQNNELVRLLEEELTEIHRILLEMTSKIGEQSKEISTSVDILAELELQFAKARFAEDYNCVKVEMWGQPPSAVQSSQARQQFTAESASAAESQKPDARRLPPDAELLLHNARHPLLERNLRTKNATIIPTTVALDAHRRQFIITGPNTGGKTVTLKTVGLLALMAQSGIPVPADRAILPIFDAVLADIGDYQSIEQNLSTFSAHVTNIDFISRTATRDSLVLLDELGSATDPEEGAALAVAIAAYFAQIGCMIVISTHHTSLKVYAANTEGVVNAAVGFDERTLQPTYELKVGVPGASAGINIAQRLGLNPAIIETARAKLGTQARDVGQFLDKLHAELREAEADRLRMQAREKELEKEKARLEQEGKKDQQAKVRELEKKLESVLRDFEYHAREAVNAIQDRAAAQKLSKDAERRVAKLRREFSEQFNSTVVAHSTGADQGDPNAQPQVVKHVSEGDTVKLKSTGRSAKITRKLDNTHYEVQIGPMKMRIARDDVAEVITSATAAPTQHSPVKAARSQGVSISLKNEDATVPTEINVIGQTVDQATSEVEKFVDRAFLAGLPRVRVVHGHGMGILRKALRQSLQKHPHVESIIEPPQNEGGAGATVVELRV